MPTVLRTACTRDCPDACQILATVEGDRVVQLRGDPAHPITRGFLCHRTDHFLERQYSPERLTSPLVRRDGVLVPATWDEALDLVAQRLRDARDQHGAESIFHYQSGGSLGLMKLLNRRFFESLGRVTFKRGDICSGAGDAAQKHDMGNEDAHDLTDLANSRSIVLWGKNVAETGVHLIPHLRAARSRGATVLQIDPVHHAKTLAHCDRHYAPRPGGDGFLALGAARALFDAGYVGDDVAGFCEHFEAYRALLMRHDVAGWARLADVSEAAVRDVAAVFHAGPTALFVGWGVGRRTNGSATIRTLDALSAISGNLGVPGGGASYYFARRGGFDVSFIKRTENQGARTLLEPRLGHELLEASPPIRVAVVDNGNPVSQLPDSTTVARGLSSVDFLVVLDAFLTDTAELAHVVLPTTTMLEEHDVVAAYGHSWVQLSRPVVPPPPGARSDFHIYQALAKRLGLDVLDGDEGEWIDRFLAPMATHGVTRQTLAEGGQRKPEAPHVLYEGRRFPTPSGRFRLIEDFPEAPPALEDGYPLVLMSISTYRSQSSQLDRAAQREAPVVTVHPDAAGGLGEGATARLASPLGDVPVVIHLDPSQRRDVAIFHKGRWAKFGGPNRLIRARVTDAGEGAAYYDQGVRLER